MNKLLSYLQIKSIIIFVLIFINAFIYMYGDNVKNANEYNIILIIALFFTGFGLIVDFLKNKCMNKRGKENAIFIFLMPSLFMTMLILRYTDFNFIKIAWPYFSVKSAESIVLTGNMSALNEIFSNFVSSFSCPLFLAILKMVTGLDVVNLIGLSGIFVFSFVINPTVYALCRFINLDDARGFNLSYILPLSAILFTPMFFIYQNVGFAFLMLAFWCIIKITTKDGMKIGRSLSVVFVLIVLGCITYYLPGGLLFVVVFLAIGFVMKIVLRGRFSASNSSYWRYSALFFMITTSYFIFNGIFFYDDLYKYIMSFLQFLRFEIIVTYTPELIVQLDATTQFVIQMTRLANAIVFLYLLGFIQAMKSKTNALIKPLSIIGGGLLIAAYSGSFVSLITDYTLRLHLYVLPFATFFAYLAIQYLCNLKGWRKFLSMIILGIILISCLFVFAFHLMTPITPRWASDNRYYRKEAFMVSAFIKNHLPVEPPQAIIANYRYYYLSSIFGIDMIELSDYTLEHFMEKSGNGILVLSLLSFEISDRYVRKLTDLDYNNITEGANLIYNNGITCIFSR